MNEQSLSCLYTLTRNLALRGPVLLRGSERRYGLKFRVRAGCLGFRSRFSNLLKFIKLPDEPVLPTAMADTTTAKDDAGIDPPPFFKTWKALYTLVLTQLLLMIIGFYFFTQFFE